jgi:hypothetical protein
MSIGSPWEIIRPHFLLLSLIWIVLTNFNEKRHNTHPLVASTQSMTRYEELSTPYLVPTHLLRSLLLSQRHLAPLPKLPKTPTKATFPLMMIATPYLIRPTPTRRPTTKSCQSPTMIMSRLVLPLLAGLNDVRFVMTNVTPTLAVLISSL